jgi:hypothetical protein
MMHLQNPSSMQRILRKTKLSRQPRLHSLRLVQDLRHLCAYPNGVERDEHAISQHRTEQKFNPTQDGWQWDRWRTGQKDSGPPTNPKIQLQNHQTFF